MEIGASAILVGLDPYVFVDQGKEDFVIRNAMLSRAMELRRKEMDYNNTMIAAKVAEVFAHAMMGR